MLHGGEQLEQSTSSFEIVDEPRNEKETSQAAVTTDHSAVREEKERILERIKRGMEEFRKGDLGESSRFQASTCVANELEKCSDVQGLVNPQGSRVGVRRGKGQGKDFMTLNKP
jgi:hypothetical protein